VPIKTLYGDVKLKVSPGTQHDERKKITNYGIPKLPPNHHQKGNHFVTFKIVIPKILNAAQQKAMLEYSRVEDKAENVSTS